MFSDDDSPPMTAHGMTAHTEPDFGSASVTDAAPSVDVLRILVVDDHEDSAAMLAEVLGIMGYEARVAHDAPTALRVAAEFRPDVALLDIGLPQVNGYELAARVRGLPGLGELRLVAVTGYGHASDKVRSREAGFHHHLVKPIELDTLEAAVQVG